MRIVYHKPQRLTGTERGLRSWVMCRSIPAAYHAQGRSHVRPVGGFSDDQGFRLCDDLPVDLGGSLNRCRHFFDFIDQPRRQAIADRSECHLELSAVWGAETLASERSDYAPKSIGEARSV